MNRISFFYFQVLKEIIYMIYITQKQTKIDKCNIKKKRACALLNKIFFFNDTILQLLVSPHILP